MLIDILWSPELRLQVEDIEVANNKLMVKAYGTQKTARCPNCQESSTRGNGRYRRHPADLPCVGFAVQIKLTVPRFFCDNERCPRRTFAARFPTMLEPYARRTNRLARQQQGVGFTTSGEAGSRLLQLLGMLTSPDTLIRLIRQAPELALETPRVLGIDDWAQRKGQTYGTILVDLEKHEVIDLLPDRSAESVANWLKAHPGVEIIARDRGSDYIDGANQGAPAAVQIADRFHLFQNAVDALKRMLEKQAKQLREAAKQVASDMQVELNQQAEEAENVALVEMPDKQPTLRELRFAEVKALQAQGWSRRAIAERLNIDRRTVGKYFEADTCPKRPSVPQSTSAATPYLSYLSRRWQEGCQNIKQLHAELEAQGFEGHYVSVYRAVRRLLKEGQVIKTVAPKLVSIPRLSVTQAAWLLVHPDDRLDEIQLKLRDKLCDLSEKIRMARDLTQSFCEILRERAADKLDTWLEEAEGCDIKAFRNFAVSLRRDYEAVKAALTYEWSSGQVEGQVNRLKFVKRQMYGRANFDLLRKRVLGMPAPT